MGRPPQGDETRRHVLALRVTTSMRDRLAAAAKASGRSIAQEVEHRFERMFWDEDMRSLGPSGRAFVELVAAAVGAVQARTGTSLDDDYPTYNAVRTATDFVLSQFDPGFVGEDRANVEATSAIIAAAAKLEEKAARKLCEVAGLPTEWSGQRALAYLVLGTEAEQDDLAAAKLGLIEEPDTFDDRLLDKLKPGVREAASALLVAMRSRASMVQEAVGEPQAAAILDRFAAASQAAQDALNARLPKILPAKRKAGESR